MKQKSVLHSVKSTDEFIAEATRKLETLHNENIKLSDNFKTAQEENNRQNSEIERLKAENTAWYQVVALLEKYVESERIKGIETFVKAFTSTADHSVSTLTNSLIYSITQKKLTELEQEMTQRHFKK